MPRTTSPAALPDDIEIFRPGRHIDDAGVVHSFGEADVDGMVAGYNPALREAPLTVGHPASNLPAYGWVKSLRKTATGALAMTSHQVEPQFAEMVEAGRFKKRSASFYPPMAPNNPTPGKWYLRHVAFLGAQPPAIAGLKDIQFSEGDAEGAVYFSEPATAFASPNLHPSPPNHQEPDDMSKELEEKLAKAQQDLEAANAATAAAQAAASVARALADKATAEAASFAEQARADRKAGFVSFAESQVKAGKLLPKDKEMAVATLEALANIKPIEFAEGDATRKVSPSQWLQDLITGAKPIVNFGEFAGQHGFEGGGGAKGKTDEEIDAAAKAWMAQHKGVNYSEALTAVTTSFTS